MTLDFQSVLLVTVFASQILVLSFYAPQRWRRYYAAMFSRYPPEQYPRLYPVPKREIERKLATFKRTYLAVGIVAAVIFVAAVLSAPSAYVFAAYMSVTCVLQVAASLPMAMSLGFRIWKAFRAMPPPSLRSAELRPWRITDFVSPGWIGLGLAMQSLGLSCAVVGYLYWPKALGPAVIMMACCGALLVTMIYSLFSPRGFSRPDPYMSGTDTLSDRQRRYRVRFQAGAIAGPFQALLILSQGPFVHFDYAYASIGSSAFMQLWALWFVSNQVRDLDIRDFSVYRADSGSQVAP